MSENGGNDLKGRHPASKGFPPRPPTGLSDPVAGGRLTVKEALDLNHRHIYHKTMIDTCLTPITRSGFLGRGSFANLTPLSGTWEFTPDMAVRNGSPRIPTIGSGGILNGEALLFPDQIMEDE